MNKIQGRILAKESGIGIPNLLVVAYDIDQRTANDFKELYKDETQGPQPVDINHYWSKINGDRIGSVITGTNGEFELSYEDNEFMIEKKEARPDLILFVLAPEQAGEENLQPNTEAKSPPVIYTSNLLRANAGKTESYIISISHSKLLQFGIEISEKENLLDGRKANIKSSISDAYQISDTIRLTANDAIRGKLSQSVNIRQKAKKIFHPLVLSAVKPELRNEPTYKCADDDLKVKHRKVIDNALENFENKKKKPAITIKISEGYNGNLPGEPQGIVSYLLDNLKTVSIEKTMAEFPKDHRKTASEYINNIISLKTKS